MEDVERNKRAPARVGFIINSGSGPKKNLTREIWMLDVMFERMKFFNCILRFKLKK